VPKTLQYCRANHPRGRLVEANAGMSNERGKAFQQSVGQRRSPRVKALFADRIWLQSAGRQGRHLVLRSSGPPLKAATGSCSVASAQCDDGHFRLDDSLPSPLYSIASDAYARVAASFIHASVGRRSLRGVAHLCHHKRVLRRSLSENRNRGAARVPVSSRVD
jgi:hypothetical protein